MMCSCCSTTSRTSPTSRQERIGSEVADHLAKLMPPHGVAVRLRATHICTQIRGVREEHSTM